MAHQNLFFIVHEMHRLCHLSHKYTHSFLYCNKFVLCKYRESDKLYFTFKKEKNYIGTFFIMHAERLSVFSRRELVFLDF